MNTQRLQSQTGYSLIDMMVAISVMSILAAAAALALVIWWIARRGRESEVTEAA